MQDEQQGARILIVEDDPDMTALLRRLLSAAHHRVLAADSGKKAMSMAGITHDDVDVAQIYDSFTITPILTLEALGFCEPGAGGVSSGIAATGGGHMAGACGAPYCGPWPPR